MLGALRYHLKVYGQHFFYAHVAKKSLILKQRGGGGEGVRRVMALLDERSSWRMQLVVVLKLLVILLRDICETRSIN